MTEETQALVDRLRMAAIGDHWLAQDLRDAIAALSTLSRDLAAARQARDAALALAEGHKERARTFAEGLRVRAIESDAAVRAARAETWAEASKMARGWLADEMLDLATAAREGQ